MPITERERTRGESERRGRDVKWKVSEKKRGQGERAAEERWKGKQGLERDGWRWTDSEERWVL